MGLSESRYFNARTAPGMDGTLTLIFAETIGVLKSSYIGIKTLLKVM